MSNKKEICKNFLILCSKGNSREAFQKYAGENFKHHNAYFKGDAESLMIAMEENAKANPEIIFKTHLIVEEENLVVTYSKFQHNADDIGYAVVHIFRFENNRIVELWDLGQQIPSDMVNENGMF